MIGWGYFISKYNAMIEKLKNAIRQSYHGRRQDVTINFGKMPSNRGYITLFAKYTPRDISITHDGKTWVFTGLYQALLDENGTHGFYSIQTLFAYN